MKRNANIARWLLKTTDENCVTWSCMGGGGAIKMHANSREFSKYCPPGLVAQVRRWQVRKKGRRNAKPDAIVLLCLTSTLSSSQICTSVFAVRHLHLETFSQAVVKTVPVFVLTGVQGPNVVCVWYS